MFKDALQNELFQEKQNHILTIDEFVEAVLEYDTLDLALVNLDESYFQFYVDNQKIVDKTLRKVGLNESEPDDDKSTLGWSRPDKIVYKTIKYKGEYITLVFDPELGSWFPTIRFRSIIKAMKYGKELADGVL